MGRWEVVHKIAASHMSSEEVIPVYISHANKLERAGKYELPFFANSTILPIFANFTFFLPFFVFFFKRYREAEKLYITANEKDLAINMYKRHRRFDDMIRLVKEHRVDLLKETHQFLAQTLEIEGSLKDAELHYIEAQEWLNAVSMYRSNEVC